MVFSKFKKLSAFVFAAGLVFGAVTAQAEEAPFGSKADVNYAAALWNAMEFHHLVGADAFHSTPYEGTAPHGAVLTTIDGILNVSGTKGFVIVKNNYGPEGLTVEDVANDPTKHLKAVTVMFKRAGYDPDNNDWFWVKYAANGSVLKNPAGMALAGRVAKGMDQGCIACHGGAQGGDYIFNHDRTK